MREYVFICSPQHNVSINLNNFKAVNHHFGLLCLCADGFSRVQSSFQHQTSLEFKWLTFVQYLNSQPNTLLVVRNDKTGPVLMVSAEYSHHLNTRLVWNSNGWPLSSIEMVWYLGLSTKFTGVRTLWKLVQYFEVHPNTSLNTPLLGVRMCNWILNHLNTKHKSIQNKKFQILGIQ